MSALQKLFIKFPDDHKEVVDRLKSTWGMIRCVGYINGCHILIVPLASNRTDL